MKAIHVSSFNPLTTHLVPDSAIVSRGNPWFLPADGNPGSWRARLLAGVCITRLGMNIATKFASRYYEAVTAAVHTNAEGTNPCMEWMRDGALLTGAGSVPAQQVQEDGLSITAGSETAALDGKEFIADINKAVSAVSAYMTLKTGDLILLDLPLEPITPSEGTDFDVSIGNTHILRFKTR